MKTNRNLKIGVKDLSKDIQYMLSNHGLYHRPLQSSIFQANNHLSYQCQYRMRPEYVEDINNPIIVNRDEEIIQDINQVVNAWVINWNKDSTLPEFQINYAYKECNSLGITLLLPGGNTFTIRKSGIYIIISYLVVTIPD